MPFVSEGKGQKTKLMKVEFHSELQSERGHNFVSLEKIDTWILESNATISFQ